MTKAIELQTMCEPNHACDNGVHKRFYYKEALQRLTLITLVFDSVRRHSS